MYGLLLRLYAVLLLLDRASGAPLHRNFVYAHFLRDGSAPTWADFARAFGLDRAETDAALEQLASDHDVVLLPHATGAPSKNYILMSHPFSNLPTCHYASHDPDDVRSVLVPLVEAVPDLTLRLFLRTPTPWHYGN